MKRFTRRLARSPRYAARHLPETARHRRYAYHAAMLVVALFGFTLGTTQVVTGIVARPAASVQPAQAPQRSCAEFVVARRMPVTGHEADTPIYVCGTPAHGSWFCKVASGEWPVPGVKLACTRVRVKP